MRFDELLEYERYCSTFTKESMTCGGVEQSLFSTSPIRGRQVGE